MKLALLALFSVTTASRFSSLSFGSGYSTRATTLDAQPGPSDNQIHDTMSTRCTDYDKSVLHPIVPTTIQALRKCHPTNGSTTAFIGCLQRLFPDITITEECWQCIGEFLDVAVMGGCWQNVIRGHFRTRDQCMIKIGKDLEYTCFF